MNNIINNNTLNLFENKMREESKSENTIKNYLYDLKQFETFLPRPKGDTPQISLQKAVKEYRQQIEKSGLSPSTLNRRILSLRAFFNVLVEEGMLDENPASSVKTKAIANQNDTKWLERPQVKAIFRAVDEIESKSRRVQQRAIISVLVNTGIRVQELCDLKINDLDYAEGMLTVTDGKGDKFRRVPFNTATQRAVRDYMQYRKFPEGEYVFQSERSEQMTTRAIQHIVKKLCENLNFNFTVHQLRHTALKNIANATGKIEIVATVAGHDNINTSKRYISPSMKEIAEAMKGVEYDF
jgi:site-specific recombinase XerD